MTDRWLLLEIKKLMQNRKRVVLLDPIGHCTCCIIIDVKAMGFPQNEENEPLSLLRDSNSETYRET